MTGIEETYLTLTAIAFQVEVNNSLNFFAFANIYEKICRVSFPEEFITP